MSGNVLRLPVRPTENVRRGWWVGAVISWFTEGKENERQKETKGKT
jgi:hypothetical protein